MEEAVGVLWLMQVIVGPIVLALALAYATFQYRRRRGLGEMRSPRQIVLVAVPVIAAVALLTFLLMIPGSQ
jgi:hypothetical protein